MLICAVVGTSPAAPVKLVADRFHQVRGSVGEVPVAPELFAAPVLTEVLTESVELMLGRACRSGVARGDYLLVSVAGLARFPRRFSRSPRLTIAAGARSGWPVAMHRAGGRRFQVAADRVDRSAGRTCKSGLKLTVRSKAAAEGPGGIRPDESCHGPRVVKNYSPKCAGNTIRA
jgi:hypothetical protein